MTTVVADDPVTNQQPKEWAFEAALERLPEDTYVPAWSPAEREWCHDCGTAHQIRNLVWRLERWFCYDCIVALPASAWLGHRG